MKRIVAVVALAGVALAGAGARLPAGASPALLAGVGIRDITPETGRNFFGYVRPDIDADGAALRLFARALVLSDGTDKVALVSIDYGTAGDKGALVGRVANRGFTLANVLFSATHTHAGPDVAFGFDGFALDQIARAIIDADDSLAPARAAWGTARLTNASMNRSIEAHLANHGMDLIKGQGRPELHPLGPEHTINPLVSVLRVETADGRPLAAWSNFSAHPTTFIPSNTFYSADYTGAAGLHFQRTFDDDAPVALFAMGTHGDQSAIFDAYNQHAVADRTGRRVAVAMRAAWDDAGDALADEAALGARWERFCFCGQDAGPGQPTSPIGFWGLAFFGGSEDGASIFYEPVQPEGRRRPAELADPVHGRKILVAPAPFSPQPELHVLRVGDRVLLATPGEVSVEMGRRIFDAVLDVTPGGVADALIVGLSSQYAGYFVTPEEFDQQHYEGGHTIFGKWSGNLLRAAFVSLVSRFAAPPDTAPGGSGAMGAGAPTGDGGVAGSLVAGPAPVVPRMQTASLAWDGGAQGRDRPVDAPFLTLEHLDGDAWTAVDSDLGLAFVWQEHDGRYTARYDVAPDLPAGTYRVRVHSARYTLATDPFEIVPSDGLIVRGATLERVGRRNVIAFVAQNPSPDPARNLLARDHSPTGGTLAFVHDGRARVAVWSDEAHAWIASARGIADGDEIEIPAGGLTDGAGNTSGPATTITVGEVAELVWPPNIGPGGGRTPGFGGEGHFPP